MRISLKYKTLLLLIGTIGCTSIKKNNREDDPGWSHGHIGWTADLAGDFRSDVIKYLLK
jgi:hypothetical protein